MSKKRSSSRASTRGGSTHQTNRERNVIHERRIQPYGQHTEDEKRVFVGTCAFDILAAASMAEQILHGDEATVPVGITLPQEFQDDPTSATAAFETISKHSKGKNEILLGCMTCCNTVGANAESGETIGQRMCRKYTKSAPILF